jgi:hypothetical protein
MPGWTVEAARIDGDGNVSDVTVLIRLEADSEAEPVVEVELRTSRSTTFQMPVSELAYVYEQIDKVLWGRNLKDVKCDAD